MKFCVERVRAVCFLFWGLVAALVVTTTAALSPAQGQPVGPSFARKELIAWCIVPFDGKKRGPEERAAMLAKLGLRHFAYDWRDEHLPSFEDEIKSLRRREIELTAVWFPAALNKDARHLLDVLARHKIKTQLWVTMQDPAPQAADRATKLKHAVAVLKPIADAAARQGCSVGLYNHGGWFGQPENLVAILGQLKLPNVGIVYNLHHGHEHFDQLPEVLKIMRPHLYAINLNGMTPGGDQIGQKILPLGQGAADLTVLRTIRDSGYRGRVGILGHTNDDAEARLLDNLEGLEWLVKQLDGADAGPPPHPRTPFPQPAKAPAQAPKQTQNDQSTADQHLVADLVASAKRDGNALRGMEVFRSEKFACLSCHRVGSHGGSIGPAMSDIGRTLTAEQIAEALLWPRRAVKPEYVAWQITTRDGRLLQGYKRKADEQAIELLETSSGQTLTISRSAVDEQEELGTLMPERLMAAMTDDQRGDLLRFLIELGVTPGLADHLDHARHHQPATFAYDRAPLHEKDWPSWQHPVNRDRVYDFYTKQADFFRRQVARPALLPPFPGLDGGKLGHWGNQNEDFWRDGRWSNTDLGTVLAGVFHGPGFTVPKAVCVRLGENGELAACFNPETLAYEAVWQGGFVKLSPVRHGFMDGLRPDGRMLPRPAITAPGQPLVYRGYYRFGNRIVFAYRVGDTELLDAPWVENGKFTRVVAPRNQHPLKKALDGGPAQWPQTFTLRGKLGSSEPYAVDTIPIPANNPWKALMFIGDNDFLSDGSALVCTMPGDVWRVTGLDDKLEKVEWRRFASGLHQALGLVVHRDQVYVLGRDQITRLHDLNRDGEADFYECFSNVMVTSPSGHDYIAGLARDPEGRFYTASSKQGLIRISADGDRAEVLATGLRNPDGLGLLPDGSVTAPSSEGDWTPASMICLVKPPEYSMAKTAGEPPHFGYGGPPGGKTPALPLVYLPRGLDNSSGGQVVVPDDRWGPLGGQLLHFSFGAGSHFLILRDEVDGQPQGAVVPLVGEFRSGAHRGKFNSKDGQLYVSGMAGWGTYTPDDGCLHRVRYTGKPVQAPRSFHVHENGVLLQFTAPVDAGLVGDTQNHIAQVWNYRYSPGYGSPDLSTRHPGVEGHDLLRIAAAHVIDEHAVFVELPDLQPVSQLHLMLRVDEGRPQELFATVHRLDKPYSNLPGYRTREKTIAAHPIAVDLASLGQSEPNPWRRRLAGARRVEIAAGKNLSFVPRVLKVRPGEAIDLVFTNPDEVPHNWVLVKADALARVGDLTNKLIADPQAVLRQYVPKSNDVLAYTDIVPPRKSFRISFHAPSTPGRYPFLCTFPGHWMVMNGQLVVE